MHYCNVMFPRTWQQIIDKVIDSLRCAHHQAIQQQYNQTKAIHYKNVGLQGGIQTRDRKVVLQKYHVSYPTNEDRSNGITIIAKNNEPAHYLYIFICRQHNYWKHTTRVLWACNQGSTLFSGGDTSSAIFTYQFFENIDDCNWSGHFKLDVINWKPQLALNDA